MPSNETVKSDVGYEFLGYVRVPDATQLQMQLICGLFDVVHLRAWSEFFSEKARSLSKINEKTAFAQVKMALEGGYACFSDRLGGGHEGQVGQPHKNCLTL